MGGTRSIIVMHIKQFNEVILAFYYNSFLFLAILKKNVQTNVFLMFVGFACGMLSVLVPVYIGEISSPRSF